MGYHGIHTDGEWILSNRTKRQTACKPGSVPRGATPRRDGHSSGTPVAGRLARSTRTAARKPAWRSHKWLAGRPYLILLRVGFAVPSPLPGPRCALTAPFHPYPPAGRRFAFCGTFPGVAPAGRYPAPCFRGARTFLPRRRLGGVEGGHPTVWLRLVRVSAGVSQ